MAIQIALFRGINVGKAKRIAMAELKAMFEDLGFSNVRTLLNSGNVVFEAEHSATATSATRIARSRSSRTHAAVAASASRARSRSPGDTAKLAPSPPNTNGNSRPSSALVTAAITAAPAMFTAL